MRESVLYEVPASVLTSTIYLMTRLNAKQNNVDDSSIHPFEQYNQTAADVI